jgi:predicted TIM-barrel fold metal-dependent hydrolase
MDIVDSQLHFGVGKIESTLEAMDVLGIKAVMIDEFWGFDTPFTPPNFPPGYTLPNGVWRTISPTAEQASFLYPDRFSYIVRVDRRDPDLECVLRLVSSAPYARAIRILPAWTVKEANAFAEGAYDQLCELAQALGLPICLFIPGFVELLPRYLSKFPRLNFIVDHCGMPDHGIPADRPKGAEIRGLDYFDEVLKLAEHPNVALKWCHEQTKFGAPEYPYEPLRPYLRRAINAFGPERLLWASDRTVNRAHSWSDLLHYLRDDPELSREEKEWILGRSARRVFNWTNATGSAA